MVGAEVRSSSGRFDGSRIGFASASFTLVLSLLAFLIAASGASGATVSVGQRHELTCGPVIDVPTLVYWAAPGEQNKVSLATVGGGFASDPIGECVQDPRGGLSTNAQEIVSDPGAARVAAGSGCRSLTRSQSACGGVEAVELHLGDGNDHLALSGFPDGALIEAGPGDDSIRSLNGVGDRVGCGDGTDTVIADIFDIVAASCEQLTLVG